MADTPVLVGATVTASTVLGLIAQKVLRTNAREVIQKDLLLAEQKRHDETREKLAAAVKELSDYKEVQHNKNNDAMVVHLADLARADKEHATELAALRREMFAANEKYDETCDKLRAERDDFKGKYMELHAEVMARKSVFIGSVEAWPTGKEGASK